MYVITHEHRFTKAVVLIHSQAFHPEARALIRHEAQAFADRVGYVGPIMGQATETRMWVNVGDHVFIARKAD